MDENRKVLLVEKELSNILDHAWVTEENQSKILNFLYFCINEAEKYNELTYNILIECDEDHRGKELAKALGESAYNLMNYESKILYPKIFFASEDKFHEQIMSLQGNGKQPMIAIIYDMQEEIPENWDDIYTKLKSHPEIIKIYVKNKNKKVERIIKDSYFNWRFLFLHLEKIKLTSKDVYNCFKFKVDKSGVKYTEDFIAGMKNMIDSVYNRKHILSEDEFVSDLIDNVKQRALGKPAGATIYDKDSVPLYEKGGLKEFVIEPPREIHHEKKNVLMLALSDLQKRKSEFEYLDGDKLEFYDDDCVYQLEPVTKYMLNKCKGESIMLIELCTDKTRRPQKEINDGGEEEAVNTKNNIKEYADEYFKKRIEEYNEKYKLGCEIIYEPIHIDETDISVGLTEAIKKLKELYETNINQFWIDTHGGFRDISLTINSIVSLLRIYNIQPTEIFGVRFSKDEGDNSDNINKIVSQREAFGMNTFVSGMNEFIEYGSAKLLDTYYAEEKNMYIKNVVAAMKLVSDGTKLCDSKLYIKGLDELGDAIDKYQFNKEISIFDIFVEYIKSDYGKLLNRTERKTIDIIKRCLERDMYQQALTFIESLMPEEFFDQGVFYYDPVDEEIIKTLRKDYYTPLKHFVFDSFIFNLENYFTDSKLNQERDKDKKSIMAIDEKSKYLDRTFYISDDGIEISENKGKGLEKTKIIKGYIECFTNVKDENSLMNAGQLMRLHKAIKNCRNMINHATQDKRPTLKNMANGIALYVQLAEKVFEDKNLSQVRKKRTGKTRKMESSDINIKSPNSKFAGKNDSKRSKDDIGTSLGSILNKIDLT